MENEINQVNTVANNAATSTRTSGSVPSSALDYLLGDEALSSIRADAANIIGQARANYETMSKGAAATRDFTKGRIENTFEVERDTLLQQGGMQRLAMREQRGMASSMAQFQVFDDTINKQMNQLTQMRDDALRAADMDYYNQLSNAQMNLINTQIAATESMFQKMFGIAGIQQSQQQIQLAQDAQAFEQESTMGSIALEFGVDFLPGDTLESVIARAIPKADEKRKLELESMRADIAAKNAQIASIKADMARADRREKAMRSLTPEMIAEMYKRDPQYVESLKAMAIGEGNFDMLEKVSEGEATAINSSIGALVVNAQKQGVAKANVLESLTSSYPSLNNPYAQARLAQAIQSVYGQDKLSATDKFLVNTGNTLINMTANPTRTAAQATGAFAGNTAFGVLGALRGAELGGNIFDRITNR